MRISPFAGAYVRKRTTEHMVDSCKIWKPGAPVVDPVTGVATRPQSTIKYEGPCRFWEVPSGTQVIVGDQQITQAQTYLSLPYNSIIPESDDVVQITDSDDIDLVGRMVNVISVVRGGGLRASRRFLVQVVESKKDTW